VKVFISWSGQLSKEVATALHSWLPQVIQSITPWMSAEDISAGMRWSPAISAELKTAHFGIICVTPDNVDAKWLQFEAGALSNGLTNAFVCPYVFGLSLSEIKGPLAQFQAVRADREGTRHLLCALNAATEKEHLPTSNLDQAFKVWWPRLQRTLASIATNSNSEHNESNDDSAAVKEILERIRNMDRNLTSKPITELYFLVSFAPTTGVGVYEFAGEKHTFTVPGSGTQTLPKRKAPAEGQVPAGYYFSSFDDLIAFCKREYLAMRKGAYYSTLFTKTLPQKQIAKTLQFLNQPTLSKITISPIVVSALKEIVDAHRVTETVLQAHELQLNNVKVCFSAELAEIVLSRPIIEILKGTPKGTAAVAAILGIKSNQGVLGGKS